MDEINDIKDITQLLIFIGGINYNFEMTEAFLAMVSLQGKMRGEDLYDSMLAVIKRHKLPWSTLANVTADVSQKSDWKKRWVAQMNPGEG